MLSLDLLLLILVAQPIIKPVRSQHGKILLLLTPVLLLISCETSVGVEPQSDVIVGKLGKRSHGFPFPIPE